MKKPVVAWWLTLIAALVAQAPLARAQQAKGNAQEEPRYDKRTVGTYDGFVSAVGSHTGRRGNPRTRVTLKTKDGVVELHLGPTVFLDENKLRLAEGDKITAIGSKVRQESGEDLIIVREATKGKQVLKLRNEEGRPLWEERHK